jgi:TolB-like protein/tetratricopeptide (TPR) repeat protein
MATARSPGSQVVCFGVYEADLRAGELRKQGVRVRLPEQPFQLLAILLEHPGEVVTRESLQKRLWHTGTFVDFEQGLNAAVKRLREALDDSAETPHLIETLPRRGYRFIGSLATPVDRIESLAVLPLEDLSHDPEQEYFAEGMTEALITSLAKIGSLRVTSRTTAMRYKKTDKTLPQIARELAVDAVVEGTVLRVGARVRISVQLVDARTDTHLWAENYDHDMRDVLTLHAEVAQATAREVQIKLTPRERAQLAHVHPVNPESYEAYLRGRYHWARRPARFEVTKAVQYFEQAIAKDRTHAAAYAGLADCLTSLTSWSLVPPSEGSNKGWELAQRALVFGPDSAQAHRAAAYAAFYNFDFKTAEKEFERAIELDPRDATAHHIFGFYLGAMGRYEEAYTELQRAIRLDPLSSIISAFLGYIYQYGHRFDQAIDQFQKTLELDPMSGLAHTGLGWAQTCKSLYGPAIESLKKGAEFWPASPPISWLGEAYAKAGRRDDARKVLEQLGQLSKRQYVTSYELGRIHAAMGDREKAFDCLEAAYEQRACWMILLKVDPCFDDLRPEPRFQDLLRRMNFPS